jgi:nitroimidazol reductase NimA-like FMN-containing flavoprotein (pyridoxamine 5'-phosphate oxidase superfamily)
VNTPKGPSFSDLSRDEAVALLGRNHVGRLAFTFHDRVDIEPISYVYTEGWVYARTSLGTKLRTLRHHPWVAFEVDEIRSRFDWQSVVVHGTVYVFDPGRGGADREGYDLAVKALRLVDADALTDSDATPHRQALFRIHVDDITGRRATPGD